MQRSDLDRVAQLFELASDGRDETAWTSRFVENVASAMRKHSSNLRSSNGSASEQRLERFRARFELNEIVADRLQARAAHIDPELAEALHELRMANSHLVSEAFSPSIHLQHIMPDGLLSANVKSKQQQDFFERQATTRQETPSVTSLFSNATPPPFNRAQSSNGFGSPRSPTNLYSSPWMSPRTTPSTPGRQRLGSYAVVHETRRCKESLQRPPQSTVIASRPNKELTLRQLRDVISKVYASKANHDKRCAEMQEPRETMEQHLYSFLGKRHGVKTAVEDWARAIFRAIERHAPHECDVAIFGKILQNNLAESFATVQNALCKSVNHLLRECLQETLPQLSPVEIDATARRWMQTGVPLLESENIVRHMYNEIDSARALQQLRELPLFPSVQKGDGSHNLQLVRHGDLIKTLISFQMQITEEVLGEFVGFFREVDIDDDGIVSSCQLDELLDRMGSLGGLSGPPELQAALQEARVTAEQATGRFKSATFSECVDLFHELIHTRRAVHAQPLKEETDEEEVIPAVCD